MIDVDPRLSLPKLLVITAFAVPIGTVEAMHWLYWNAAQKWPLETGTVIRREEYRRWGGIPSGRLHVRVAKDQSVVTANISRSSLFKVPIQIRVHYSGNPKDQAVLENESNPLWLTVFFWGITILLWNLYLFIRKNPKLRSALTG